jgi:hypothetical protein
MLQWHKLFFGVLRWSSFVHDGAPPELIQLRFASVHKRPKYARQFMSLQGQTIEIGERPFLTSDPTVGFIFVTSCRQIEFNKVYLSATLLCTIK